MRETNLGGFSKGSQGKAMTSRGRNVPCSKSELWCPFLFWLANRQAFFICNCNNPETKVQHAGPLCEEAGGETATLAWQFGQQKQENVKHSRSLLTWARVAKHSQCFITGTRISHPQGTWLSTFEYRHNGQSVYTDTHCVQTYGAGFNSFCQYYSLAPP